jgi:hypothetical protein
MTRREQTGDMEKTRREFRGGGGVAGTFTLAEWYSEEPG